MAIATVLAFGAVARADGTNVTVEVCAFDSTGASLTLGGDQAWIQVNGGSIDYVGPVGGSGCREYTVLAGASVATWVGTGGTYQSSGTTSGHHVQIATTSPLVFNFYTTKVTIQYPGEVAFGGPHGDYGWFKQTAATASQELFSNGTPTMFRADSSAGQIHDIAVTWPEATGPGAAKTFSLMAAQVKTNAGTGEAGATVRYQDGLYWYAAPGATDTDGLLGWSFPGLSTNVTVEARVNYTTQSQSYDASTQGLVSFQTTNLALHYAGGAVRYVGVGGYTYYYTEPSMEMFAGTYPFGFYSPAGPGSHSPNPGSATSRTDITVPAPLSGPVTLTAAVVRFQDSTGAGLAGSVSYYLGGWSAGGTTDSQVPWQPPWTPSPGSAVVLFPGAPTNVVFALSYDGQRQQLPAQNVQVNAVAYFHTTAVTVSLRDHSGNRLDTGNASYYANGWHSIGATVNGDVQQEMLPGTYSFAMTYLGTREQLNNVNVGVSSSVVFQTTDVTVLLRDHSGSPLDTGNASYYANGWHSIGATVNGDVQQEMLPGTYSFAMTYLGTRQQQDGVDVGANPSVVFTTGAVQSTSGNATAYYANGWQPFTQDMELLPGTYWFSFSGAPQAQEAILGGTVNAIP